MRIKLLFNIISGTAISINTGYIMNNNYNLSEVIVLKGKGIEVDIEIQNEKVILEKMQQI